MVDRISSHALSQTLTRELLRLQTSYAATQIQSTSTLQSETYQGIAEDSRRLLNLESEYSRLASQSENGQIALNRIDTMYTATGSMLDLINTAKKNLSAAMSGTSDTSALTATLSQNLEDFAATLNTKQAGRYLFGGNVTASAPENLYVRG